MTYFILCRGRVVGRADGIRASLRLASAMPYPLGSLTIEGDGFSEPAKWFELCALGVRFG